MAKMRALTLLEKSRSSKLKKAKNLLACKGLGTMKITGCSFQRTCSTPTIMTVEVVILNLNVRRKYNMQSDIEAQVKFPIWPRLRLAVAAH